MKITLLEHQKSAVDFIDNTTYQGALLWHEMGLGKTVSALFSLRNLIAKLKGGGCSNPKVICLLPKSMLNQWKAETQKFAPDIFSNIIFLPYSQLKKAKGLIMYYDVRALVLDESHYIKTQGTNRVNELVELLTAIHGSHGSFKGGKIICLSGTPMLNHAGEIYTTWALLASPNIEKSAQLLVDGKRYEMWKQSFTRAKEKSWSTRFGGKKYGTSAEGVANNDKLNKLIGPIIHLRKASDCLDLPPKQVIPIDLGLPDDRLLADAGKDGILDEESYMKILSELAKAKTTHAIDWIRNFLSQSSEQLIVFCPYKFPLEEIQKVFKNKCMLYTGAQSTGERKEAMDAFKNGSARIALGTYKAMGVGLNMQFAHTTLYLGYPWTSGDVDQAMARTDRMGQQGRTLHYFLMSGANDHRILNLVKSKEEMIQVVEGGLKEYEYRDLSNLGIDSFL